VLFTLTAPAETFATSAGFACEKAHATANYSIYSNKYPVPFHAEDRSTVYFLPRHKPTAFIFLHTVLA